jgi:hypothetical protein
MTEETKKIRRIGLGGLESLPEFSELDHFAYIGKVLIRSKRGSEKEGRISIFGLRDTNWLECQDKTTEKYNPKDISSLLEVVEAFLEKNDWYLTNCSRLKTFFGYHKLEGDLYSKKTNIS